MKRILFASAALVALTGAAFAQQAPVLQGNYSANVIEQYDRESDINSAGLMIGGSGWSMRAFDFDDLEIRGDDGTRNDYITGDLADREDNRGR